LLRKKEAISTESEKILEETNANFLNLMNKQQEAIVNLTRELQLAKEQQLAQEKAKLLSTLENKVEIKEEKKKSKAEKAKIKAEKQEATIKELEAQIRNMQPGQTSSVPQFRLSDEINTLRTQLREHNIATIDPSPPRGTNGEQLPGYGKVLRNYLRDALNKGIKERKMNTAQTIYANMKESTKEAEVPGRGVPDMKKFDTVYYAMANDLIFKGIWSVGNRVFSCLHPNKGVGDKVDIAVFKANKCVALDTVTIIKAMDAPNDICELSKPTNFNIACNYKIGYPELGDVIFMTWENEFTKPSDVRFKVCDGKVEHMDDKFINYTIPTNIGASGCPITNESNKKIYGWHLKANSDGTNAGHWFTEEVMSYFNLTSRFIRPIQKN